MLRISGLETSYGRSQVLFGLDLEVGEGEVVTLLGRNGMGKTTTVRSIMGLTRPHGGSVTFSGRELRGLAPHKIARCGVGLVPEGRGIFVDLTVRENLTATARAAVDRSRRWTLDSVLDLFPWMRARGNQLAAVLSGGELQMLSIGRALMTNPKLLILDEATEGLAPLIRLEIWRVLAALKQAGQSILLIDKNLKEVIDIADRHYVIERGQVKWRGTSSDVRAQLSQVRSLVGV